jgi:hypothetical protein
MRQDQSVNRLFAASREWSTKSVVFVLNFTSYCTCMSIPDREEFSGKTAVLWHISTSGRMAL